ncbi:uncharacterized protein LOC121635309 isoform X3 [Melanotaenia boesemani]|uniref:uncharacterized protein LOC121635309 isoform X3 n=1 Tax=Melanotaenia boesemani TaxID=1250792 RepID=UPI001C040016|nr:uncharacterized protein LOC121635309 isoform X3 [Melanotaenia boesemani]
METSRFTQVGRNVGGHALQGLVEPERRWVKFSSMKQADKKLHQKDSHRRDFHFLPRSSEDETGLSGFFHRSAARAGRKRNSPAPHRSFLQQPDQPHVGVSVDQDQLKQQRWVEEKLRGWWSDTFPGFHLPALDQVEAAAHLEGPWADDERRSVQDGPF